MVGVSATERWLVLRSIRVARPRARARQRFSVGPSSTRMSAIRRSSATSSWFASAFAAADSINRDRSRAASLLENASSVRASSTGMPRTWSATRRALRGATRTNRALARTIGASGLLVTRRQRHRSALPLPEWARKVRVGANSPSLWPTIDSETNTGTCLRPSWTAIVCPTISGKTVDERDQVLIICFWFVSLSCWMRRSSRSSANGPFFVDLPIEAPTSSSSRAGGRG